ncbi:aminotransferase class I/II-fold pyridoxal phosphate-dependent enzyme [Acinetobacter baumannii]|uniref:aminotransferase class I/II-fold pyridoxal phosphate-dependent enzyme n=1 Tax=Acinetobacter baumannii TaxID=470 RepID=UPI002341F7E5|nr:aminotransferase class I/II-fold pyridoxal phosphate-dependent enzyme [Acinetobacter baumannii]MDC4414439.1 aminotransferase class I/II-fold pyridoxal phosphate-dependent enzyme [Acinetobacter baumannii]MDH2520316.1 aminotransferase class I/II-fold pyridoxal phosphate-dependent enzyme [Acinetobacter baumannii]MDK2200809.1 aminotransferase class I/II-fold pyridoxal phosphate-dependent enzyme [Acinetobacter baumannii]
MNNDITITKTKARNAARMAEISRPHFNSAYEKGLMGVSCRVNESRQIEITTTGQVVVDYTRCGYLNLDSHPDVLASAQQSMDEIKSVHFSVARTRLSAEPLWRLEKKLSDLFDVSGIIVFPTVAAANMGALPLLAAGLFTGGVKPLIVFDRFAHVTLQYHIPVLREETDVLIIEHNDLAHLEELCRSGRPVAYVGDGAYSMGGAAPVRELHALQEKYGLFIYLDDAHGISVVGKHGEGFVRSQLDHLNDKTIIAASLGKGFGAAGGLLMLGSKEIENTIRRYAPTYAFSCAPNTAAVGAALASAEIHATPKLQELQLQLQKNLSLFDELIPTETKGSPLPIRIIRINNAEKAIAKGEYLLQQGHYVSVVFFPTVPIGQAALRVAVTAAHDPKDIIKLASLLELDHEVPLETAKSTSNGTEHLAQASV